MDFGSFSNIQEIATQHERQMSSERAKIKSLINSYQQSSQQLQRRIDKRKSQLRFPTRRIRKHRETSSTFRILKAMLDQNHQTGDRISLSLLKIAEAQTLVALAISDQSKILAKATVIKKRMLRLKEKAYLLKEKEPTQNQGLAENYCGERVDPKKMEATQNQVLIENCCQEEDTSTKRQRVNPKEREAMQNQS